MRFRLVLLATFALGCAVPRAAVVREHAPAPKKKLLTAAEAGAYMLELTNRDRKANRFEPVAWDDVAAKAGRGHAEDMARRGFTGHYGSDGSVPELRYTRAGGTHFVQENAACIGDGAARGLDKAPLFEAKWIEEVQASFMAERPPSDGHRRNILTPWHNHVGIGIAKPAGVPVVCLAQEFVDQYGRYTQLPATAKVGQKVEIAGEMGPSAKLGGVGLARIALPKPRKADELNALRRYAIPQPYVTYFPKGFVSPVPVEVQGSRFTIKVPLSEQAQMGVYEVSVWAHVPGTKEIVMVSLRTIIVR